MDSLVMKDLHPRKRWKSRILHQKCILITCHSWARGLLARHYMFKTTQKFQRVNQQWPYQVQWMFNSLYMACGYVNSPLQWHQHHPESPPELPGTASDSNSVVRSIGVRRKSWACFEIPGHCFPWLSGIQRHIFSKRIPIFRNWKNWEKKKWEVNLASLCFVAAGLVLYAPGNVQLVRPKTIDPIYQTMGALWCLWLSAPFLDPMCCSSKMCFFPTKNHPILDALGDLWRSPDASQQLHEPGLGWNTSDPRAPHGALSSHPGPARKKGTPRDIRATARHGVRILMGKRVLWTKNYCTVIWMYIV